MADLRSVLVDHYERFGSLKDEDLVREATVASHPLHDRFEWDDQVAGHQYRCWQARQLVKTVKQSFSNHDGERRSVRFWLSSYEAGNPEVTAGTFEPAEQIMADPIRAEIELRSCKRAIADLRRRYEHLAEFKELVQRGLLQEEG
jgi:hypothetical protein